MPFLMPESATVRDIHTRGRENFSSSVNESCSFVGVGGECFVFEHPFDTTKVVAVSWEGMSPENAKVKFYVQRILNILFPHNFPKIHSAFSAKKEDTYSGTIRERVCESSQNEPVQTIKFPLETALSRAQDIFSIRPFLDAHTQANFMVGIDGGEYYVDTPYSFTLPISKIDIWEVVSRMATHGYTKGDQRKVKTSLLRLQKVNLSGMDSRVIVLDGKKND